MSSGFYVRPGLGKKLKSARWSGEILPLRFSWGNEVSWKQEVKETLEKWGTKTRRSGRWSRDRTVKKKKKKSLIFAWGDQSSGSSNGQTAPARRRFHFVHFWSLFKLNHGALQSSPSYCFRVEKKVHTFTQRETTDSVIVRADVSQR